MTKSIHEEVAKRRGLVRLPEATDEEHKEAAIKFLASGREREKQTVAPTLIVTSPIFFLRRDAKMVPTSEFSKKVIDAVQARFVNILVMCPKEEQATYDKPLSDLPFLSVCWINKQDVRATMRSVVDAVQARGLKFYLPSNPREVSWLNIKKYLGNQDVVVVGANDYSVAGIQPDKEPNFKELARERSRNGW